MTHEVTGETKFADYKGTPEEFESDVGVWVNNEIYPWLCDVLVRMAMRMPDQTLSAVVGDDPGALSVVMDVKNGNAAYIADGVQIYP